MIRRAVLALVILELVAAAPIRAQTSSPGVRVENFVAPDVLVQLDGVGTGALVVMLMRDVLKVPYVIAPDVLADRRPMSVNLVMPRSDLPSRVIGFLRGTGFDVQLRGGTVYVAKKALAASSSGSAPLPVGLEVGASPSPAMLTPPRPAISAAPGISSPVQNQPVAIRPGAMVSAGPEAELAALSTTAIILPAHRQPFEFREVLESILPGLAIAAREGSEPEGMSIGSSLSPDRLVIGGPRALVDRALAIIAGLDKPRPSVAIRAVILEVSDTNESGSALSILANVLGGNVSLSSGTPAEAGGAVLRVALGGVAAVLSAVSEDGRFKVVAEPSLMAVSGSVATLRAGAQVPTLGAVTLGEDGGSLRSIVYRDSGVSLSVRPVVLPGEIQLTVQQERSSFARTLTGVNDSPTLNQTTATAQLILTPGQTVAIAGLDEQSESDTRSGLFGGLLPSRTRSNRHSQLVLLVQADLVPDVAERVASVTIIGPTDEPAPVRPVLDLPPA